jgi:UDPglucose 6-dehydrogenase
MNVVVVGCGYVGLVSGVCFATLGHKVLGVEIDEGRAELIESGTPPFHEPGLEEMLQSCLSDGTFRVTSQIEEAVAGEVIFLCVQTPLGPDGELNTNFLADAVRQVAVTLSDSGGRHVLVVRSTVVPGTTETLVAPISRAHNPAVAVASNPEFLREGSAVADFLEPDRIVIGCKETWAADLVADLYASLMPVVVHVTPSAAELAKCASNALLATLISFSNQLARIAEAIPGVDVEDVLAIIHKDRRLSPVTGGQTISPGILAYLKPGCGFGGACLPKDLSALNHYASSVGEPAGLLQAAIDINQTQPARVVSITRDALGGLEERHVTLLGLAFKAGTDDLRESPGLRIVDLLLREGTKVVAYDPLVAPAALRELEDKGVTIASDIQAAIRDADACVIATRATEFREVGEILHRKNDKHTVVIDGRRLLEPNSFDDQDSYSAVGRSRREFPKSARDVKRDAVGIVMTLAGGDFEAKMGHLGRDIESLASPLRGLVAEVAGMVQSFT